MSFTLMPFIVVLMALALGPTFFPQWWERVEERFLLILTTLSAMLTYYNQGPCPLAHTFLNDYLPFMVMIVVLSLVGALIAFHKEGKATPLYNVMYLALGALIANIIGTMAAAIVMLPAFTHLNRHQKSFQHGVVFFIFIVCNIGACLSPLGDPPLLIGYLRGVPFGWTFVHLWKAWFWAIIPLLGLFYVVDKNRNPQAGGLPRMIHKPSASAACMLAIVLGITILLPAPYREIALLAVAGLAWYMKARIDAPTIRNIACLFLALFITLIPVQVWLGEHAHHLASPSPFVNFWLSGLFSAFLDNTPTYIVWTQLHNPNLVDLANNNPVVLEAISLGCVWMGALSYIGNAPNLVVKSFAGRHAPSFLGYMVWAWGILVPLFLAVSFLMW